MTSAPAILERRRARRALAAALAMGVALLAVAPFLGILRDLLIARLPRAFAPVLLAGFALAAGGALLLAALRIRERRAARYAALALAVALAAALLGLFRTGLAEVDAVERIHVLAYGLLAFLFARAFAPRRDLSAYLLAFLATALCGILDEWVQWLVPTRVGDIRDVGLNAGAAVPGLLVAWAAAP
ncbi:MAG: VanZ family protein, partial [Acidobacteriota bacterium]|nr:VanZ family protein [Acidobacteriota bacterium]